MKKNKREVVERERDHSILSIFFGHWKKCFSVHYSRMSLHDEDVCGQEKRLIKTRNRNEGCYFGTITFFFDFADDDKPNSN